MPCTIERVWFCKYTITKHALHRAQKDAITKDEQQQKASLARRLQHAAEVKKTNARNGAAKNQCKEIFL